MRSNLSSIDQLLMCMNKSQPGTQYPTPTPSIVKLEQYPICSPDNSATSYDDNEIIEFGPIKVKPRKKPAPTLATGRRSKYEILSAEEEQKRNVRRTRNRAAAERVRVSRLSIEQKLQNQIDALEEQQQNLSDNVQTLQHQKLHLETRLFTHEQMCHNVTGSNFAITSQIDLTTYLPLDNASITFQQYGTTLNDKISDFDFDDLINGSLTAEEIQQILSESSIPTMLGDDLNDLLMDS